MVPIDFIGLMLLASLPLTFCFAAMSAMMSRIRPDRPNLVYFADPPEVSMQPFAAPRPPDGLREFRLITSPGVATYTCSREITRIGSAWIEFPDGMRYLLAPCDPREMAWDFNNPGRPQHFAYAPGVLCLYPVPDERYDIVFVDISPQQMSPSLIEQMTRQLRDAMNANLYGARNSMQEVHDRSMALLKEWLTPAQRQQFEQHNYFDVVGSRTKNHYRIRGGIEPYNVAQLKKGQPVMCWCFVPTFGFGGAASLGDTLLAQKIMLENDELTAMEIAHRTTSNSYLLQFDALAAAGSGLTPP